MHDHTKNSHNRKNIYDHYLDSLAVLSRIWASLICLLIASNIEPLSNNVMKYVTVSIIKKCIYKLKNRADHLRCRYQRTIQPFPCDQQYQDTVYESWIRRNSYRHWYAMKTLYIENKECIDIHIAKYVVTVLRIYATVKCYQFFICLIC